MIFTIIITIIIAIITIIIIIESVGYEMKKK